MSESLSHFTHNISQWWRYLRGNSAEFSLEARIFHSFSLGLIILAFLYIPYNFYAGLFIAALSCIIFGSLFFYEYYRSRFLLRQYRSRLFGFSGLLLLSINYFANAGIEGSTDLIWPVFLLLLLTICPYKYMLTWTITYLAVFALIHLLEYYHPELIQHPFRPGHGQLTDRITAFPLPVFGIAIVMGFFRRNYDKERALVAQRDNEKSRLFSIISHDLRSPFLQVQQYFELLNNNAFTEEERKLVEQGLKQTNEQTLHLVTNLLYWSRSQLEGLSIQIKAVSLKDTLTNTLEMASRQCKEKGILFTHDIAPEIQVMADSDMLQVVVRNLLQNAIKFTEPGNPIQLVTETLNQNCRLHVIDHGIGIPPQQLQQLFSGMYTTPGTANEKGVGLGLQLCKEFMERQNGSIEAKSELEKGSMFTITFPLA